MQQAQKRSDSSHLVKVLYWATVAVAIWFAYLNIRPYATAVGRLTYGAVDRSLMHLIAEIPVINGIAATFGLGLYWLVGFVLWLVIQTVEIFPVILKRDRAFMRTLITEADQTSKFALKDNDDPALAALKRWYNRFPTLTIARARNAALFVYALDFTICLSIYPPCKGGFRPFMFILSTGQYSRLNWQNILLLLFTVFAIEVIVRFLLWLGQIAYFMRSAHGPAVNI
jgi:hypothetical protein